jgi:glycosyltransferase involved in cell wall biosynthesis
MACGAPVIASRIAALQETLGDAAVLVPATDTAALAGAIVDLLTKTQPQARRGAGLQHAAMFSWKKAAELTREVYENVLR